MEARRDKGGGQLVEAPERSNGRPIQPANQPTSAWTSYLSHPAAPRPRHYPDLHETAIDSQNGVIRGRDSPQ